MKFLGRKDIKNVETGRTPSLQKNRKKILLFIYLEFFVAIDEEIHDLVGCC